MKFFKNNILVVGAMALTLTLFSFKPADSNEVNLGEASVLYTSLDVETTSPKEAMVRRKLVDAAVDATKKVVSKVKEGAKVTWDKSGKKIVEVAIKAITWNLILSTGDEFDDRMGANTEIEYKLNRL